MTSPVQQSEAVKKAVYTIETAILKADSADTEGYRKRLFGCAMGSLRELEMIIETNGAALQKRDEVIARLSGALQEVEKICSESIADCRKRMGTRAGNSSVVAHAALVFAREHGAK